MPPLPAHAISPYCRGILALALCLLTCDAWAIEPPRFHWTLSPAERARLIFLQVVAAAYIFTLASALGSFLNVVIYRLPRGLNIARPRSRCPACATPIEMRDNLPVLGWLLLRGKCRICGGPISPRYPLVEGTIGSLVLLLCWLEVRLGGVNLPNWTPAPLDDLMILSWNMPWGNLLLVAYHAWLLIALFVMALIQGDGFPIPGVIVRLALAVGILLPLAWPWLRPLPALGDLGYARGLIDGLSGAAAGLLGGGILGLLAAARSREARKSLVYALLLIGTFLGWQAAISIGLLCVIPLLIARVAGASRLPPLLWPTLATWLYVPLWKQAAELTERVLSY